MLACAELFTDKLKSEDLEYDVREMPDGDVVVAFPYKGMNTLYIFSGEEGGYVSMATRFETVPDDKVTDLYAVCNQLNSIYKWLKFYVDKDNDLMVQDDAILSADSAGEECFELLIRRIKVLEDVKPAIMRALYL